jgi:hypothetical protein
VHHRCTRSQSIASDPEARSSPLLMDSRRMAFIAVVEAYVARQLVSQTSVTWCQGCRSQVVAVYLS